jgi:hypothetical protein
MLVGFSSADNQTIKVVLASASFLFSLLLCHSDVGANFPQNKRLFQHAATSTYSWSKKKLVIVIPSFSRNEDFDLEVFLPDSCGWSRFHWSCL